MQSEARHSARGTFIASIWLIIHYIRYPKVKICNRLSNTAITRDAYIEEG